MYTRSKVLSNGKGKNANGLAHGEQAPTSPVEMLQALKGKIPRRA